MFFSRFTRRRKLKSVKHQLEQIISEQILITARFAAAKNDPRPINCVSLDKKEGKIKATDGVIYCVIEDERIKEIPYNIMIPIDVVKCAVKKSNKDFPFVEIHFNKEEFSICGFRMKASDSKFPDDKNVTNICEEKLKSVDIDNKHMKINIRYINKLGKMQKALGLGSPMFCPVYLSNKTSETDFKAFKFEFLNCQVYIAPLL